MMARQLRFPACDQWRMGVVRGAEDRKIAIISRQETPDNTRIVGATAAAEDVMKCPGSHALCCILPRPSGKFKWSHLAVMAGATDATSSLTGVR